MLAGDFNCVPNTFLDFGHGIEACFALATGCLGIALHPSTAPSPHITKTLSSPTYHHVKWFARFSCIDSNIYNNTYHMTCDTLLSYVDLHLCVFIQLSEPNQLYIILLTYFFIF